MRQAFRGFAYTALAAGQDVSERISQLYAPPGAWSHGSLWGADVIEIPAGDASFNPATTPVADVNELQGGVRTGGPADWYALTVRGTAELQAVLDVLRSGVDGEVAEASVRERLRRPDAGRLADLPRRRDDRGRSRRGREAAGVYFERGVGRAGGDAARRGAADRHPRRQRKPRRVRHVLVAAPDLRARCGLRLGHERVELAAERGDRPAGELRRHLQRRPDLSARQHRAGPPAAFFERGGGYIATSQSASNFAFLTGAHPALIKGNLTQGSDGAGGGIALWDNVGASGPLTGGYPATDNLYLPANVTWFSSLPTGATVDGRYLPSVGSTFIAGLWRDRDRKAASAPIIVHGTTLVGSRYLGLATNPFSRGDAEREWPLIGQAALWSNLTDD